MTPQVPARWWPVAGAFFRFGLQVPLWMLLSVIVGLATADGATGVIVGAVIAIGVPWLVLWPAMRRSARERGLQMTLRKPPGGRLDL